MSRREGAVGGGTGGGGVGGAPRGGGGGGGPHTPLSMSASGVGAFGVAHGKLYCLLRYHHERPKNSKSHPNIQMLRLKIQAAEINQKYVCLFLDCVCPRALT